MGPIKDSEFVNKVNSLGPSELAELEIFVDSLLAKHKAAIEAEAKGKHGSSSEENLLPDR